MTVSDLISSRNCWTLLRAGSVLARDENWKKKH